MRICQAPKCPYAVFGTDKKTRKGYCRFHQWMRTDLVQKFRTPKPIKYKARRPSGELKMFLEIAQERELVSYISGISLKNVPSYLWINIFAHGLSKKMYPEARLDKNNIFLLTPIEHTLFDNGTHEQREAYVVEVWLSHRKKVDWTKLYIRVRELKDYYDKKSKIIL